MMHDELEAIGQKAPQGALELDVGQVTAGFRDDVRAFSTMRFGVSGGPSPYAAAIST